MNKFNIKYHLGFFVQKSQKKTEQPLILDSLYAMLCYIALHSLIPRFNYHYSIGHSFSWKIIKPHMNQVLEQIVLPLLCHSDEDEELWTSDPVEYIRVKYG